MEFYRCEHCGNMIAYVEKSGIEVVCCGEKMEKIAENTVDASAEKHVPVIRREGEKVFVHVGSLDHPMEEKHYIQWIALETQNGNQRKVLKAGEAPEAVFYVAENDVILKAYAYCNLHGLWSA